MSRKPTDTKQRILDTAANLFSSYGFGTTSVDDILTAVGITKGAFYHYFKGKDALCEAVLDQAIEAFDQLAEVVQTNEDSSDLLEHWLQMLIEKQDSGQWLHFRLISRLSVEAAQLDGTIQNKLRTFWLWCQSFYETLIQRSARDKGLELGIEPAAAARLFVSAHYGAVWMDRCAPCPEDLASVMESLFKTVFK